jgi:tetratricopeptide (TPR) repeat protein
LKLAGASCLQKGKTKDAKQYFRQLSDAAPKDPDGPYNIGVLVEEERQFPKALTYYREALQRQSNHHGALLNSGRCLVNMGRHAEAAPFFERVIIEHSDKKALNNLGVIALHMNEPAKAQAYFEEVLQYHPTFEDALFNLSGAHLMQERFVEGWQYYETRFFKSPTLSARLEGLKPRWDFTPGVSLLVWAEQGVGDVVMFSGLLDDVIRDCRRVHLAVDPRLHPLYRRRFGDSLVLHQFDEPLELIDAEVQIPLASAMSRYRRSSSEFAASRQGYFSADTDLVQRLRAQIVVDTKPLIGVSWHTTNRMTGMARNVPFASLLQHYRGQSVRLVNLQYGPIGAELKQARKAGVDFVSVDAIDTLNDIDGLCALISACDAVVTIDNSTAHFAGALGVPVSVLLPHYCDWRWGLHKRDSLFYASASLLRQTTPGDWDSVLAQLKSETIGV